jgi:hypothetical protein
MSEVRHGMSRRRFLGLTGVGGLAAGGVGGGWAMAAPLPLHRVVQSIDEIRMYVTHYAFFEEPDPELPDIPYLDMLGRPDHSLDLAAPIGEQVFAPVGKKQDQLVQTSATFKTMPYLIAPPGFSEMPPPPQVIGALQAVLHLPSAAAVLAHLDTLTLAIGQFTLPPPGSVTGLLSGGRNFAVTKEVRFRVQIKLAWAYDDGASALGIVSPFLTNAEVATFLGVDPGPTPSAPLAYEWAGPMTLDTRNHYRRKADHEPPPVANAFEPDLVKIDLRGEKLDEEGHYTLVGSVSRPQFLASPFASLPAVLSLLFGTTALTDMELAYSESGRLIKS